MLEIITGEEGRSELIRFLLRLLCFKPREREKPSRVLNYVVKIGRVCVRERERDIPLVASLAKL